MPKNIMSVKKRGGRKCSTSPVMPMPESPKMDLAATVQPVPAVRAMMNSKALAAVHLGSSPSIYSPFDAEPERVAAAVGGAHVGDDNKRDAQSRTSTQVFLRGAEIEYREIRLDKIRP
jgi:hypothetical protein